jgi:acetyl-CoA C-acetyltransferase
MAKLKPVFDRKYGSVTAANSSPLTDGASAVLVMSDEKARALGYEPLTFVRSYAVAAVDPGWQLLQAPIFAVPMALERAGIQWQDLGLIEIHEAFAAQVLCTLKAWESEKYCRDRLGLPRALGSIDRAKLNVKGGSVAVGHPFAATGARIVATLGKLLATRGSGRGLISVCTAGGMGVTAIMER